MSAATICAQIDADAAPLLPLLEERQAAWAAANNGIFFQGLAVPATIPADGNYVPAGNDTVTPTYQDGSWGSESFPLTTLAAQIECHQYQSGQGNGYILYMRVNVTDATTGTYDLWQEALDFGPLGMSQPWAIVPPSTF
jgi:hypothetical protein